MIGSVNPYRKSETKQKRAAHAPWWRRLRAFFWSRPAAPPHWWETHGVPFYVCGLSLRLRVRAARRQMALADARPQAKLPQALPQAELPHAVSRAMFRNAVEYLAGLPAIPIATAPCPKCEPCSFCGAIVHDKNPGYHYEGCPKKG